MDLFGHNPASPPYTARKGLEQPPRQYRQRKQTPFVPHEPSQRRLRYMIHPSSLLQSQKLQNTPTFTFPPSTSSGRGQDSEASYETPEKTLSSAHVESHLHLIHLRSLHSRLTGSQIQCYTELVNMSGTLLGVERKHKTHNITFHYPNLPLQKRDLSLSLLGSWSGQKRAPLNALFSLRSVIT